MIPNQIYVEPAIIGRLLGFFAAGFFFTGILGGPADSICRAGFLSPSLIIQASSTASRADAPLRLSEIFL